LGDISIAMEKLSGTKEEEVLKKKDMPGGEPLKREKGPGRRREGQGTPQDD